MSDRPTLNSLQPLFTFPFRDHKWQNRFLIGVLVFFAGFAIPILPGIVLLGYTLRITRQAIHDQELHLPAWDDWGRLALDGLRAFVVSLVYLLPGSVVMLGGSAVYFASTIAIPSMATAADADRALFLAMPLVLLVSMGIMFLSMFLGMILSVLGAIPLPIATARFADKDQVAAAFKLRALWAILKANAWGYLVAWTIVMGLFGMLYIVFAAVYMSMVLCCLLPIVVAPAAFYLSTVSAAVFGRAYRESQLALQDASAE
jgi:hypothetical protein